MRKCGHFDCMYVGRTVKLQPVDTEEYYEYLPKPCSIRIFEGKSHIAISLNGQGLNRKTASTMDAVSIMQR